MENAADQQACGRPDCNYLPAGEYLPNDEYFVEKIVGRASRPKQSDEIDDRSKEEKYFWLVKWDG